MIFAHESLQPDSPHSIHAFAIEVADRLSQDISSVLSQTNTILSDAVTYKQLLSCRGSVAQHLLDLLQDVCPCWSRNT
jgi:hypothetical protein